MKHGDKIESDRYVCIYSISNDNVAEFIKLAKAVSCYPSKWMKKFPFIAEAVGLTSDKTEDKIRALGLDQEVKNKKYSPGGGDAFLDVLEKLEGQADNFQLFLIAFSCEKLKPRFCFKQDAAKIEIMVSVLSHKELDYTSHLGIQRSICYALKENPFHPSLSMQLHGVAATFIQENFREKRFMVTNPLESMKTIFTQSFNEREAPIHTVSNYNLSPMRQALAINLEQKSPYFYSFNTDFLREEKLLAVSLDDLASFCPAIQMTPEEPRSSFSLSNPRNKLFLAAGITFFATAAMYVANTVLNDEETPTLGS